MEKTFDEAAPSILVGSEDVSRAVQEIVVPLLRHHYDSFIAEVPGEKQGGSTPATYVLVAGYAGDTPFIVDIDPHGLIGRYEEVGFHAIGSGSGMAQQAGALLAHFSMTERDVDHGVLVAVRVLDALRTTLAERGRSDRRLPDHPRGGGAALRARHRQGPQAGGALAGRRERPAGQAAQGLNRRGADGQAGP